MKVLATRFYLNGHTTGFCPKNHKPQLPYKTPLLIYSGSKRVNSFWCILQVIAYHKTPQMASWFKSRVKQSGLEKTQKGENLEEDVVGVGGLLIALF